MLLPYQPKCICFDCKFYGLVYSSLVDTYKCKQCKVCIEAKFIEDIVTAYGVYRSLNPPSILPNYNAICCFSCLKKGGLYFKERGLDMVYCNLCKYNVSIYNLHEAMTSAYKTKLIETTYHTLYSVFGEDK